MGLLVGILTMLMGVGGGFILVPVMLYILGMSGNVVVGTSLFQILFVTMSATMVHALTTKAVDIVLAALLLLGSVLGAERFCWVDPQGAGERDCARGEGGEGDDRGGGGELGTVDGFHAEEEARHRAPRSRVAC